MLVSAAAAALSLTLWLGLPGRAFWTAAHAGDGDGGSTVPVQPPRPPTPPADSGSPRPGPLSLDFANLSLSVEARAETAGGVLVPVFNRPVRLTAPAPGVQEVVLPLALPSGERVKAFRDPGSSVEWRPALAGFQGGVLTVPLRGGEVPGALVLRLADFQGNGAEVMARILGAGVEIGPAALEGPDSGAGSMSVTAELRQVPAAMTFTVTGTALDAEAAAALRRAAAASGAGLADVAFAARVRSSLADELRSATVRMAVAPSWVARWGEARARIARLGDDGAVQVLETKAAGADALGRRQFQAASAKGFSTFALVALEGQPASPPPGGGVSTGAVVGIIIGALAGAGLLGGGLWYLRRTRRGAV